MTTRITSENITDATITSTDLEVHSIVLLTPIIYSNVEIQRSQLWYLVEDTLLILQFTGLLKLPLSASRGDYVEIKDYVVGHLTQIMFPYKEMVINLMAQDQLTLSTTLSENLFI